MSTQSLARKDGIGVARERIADCFEGRDGQGRLVQRRDALNLAGLGLAVEDLEGRFVVEERGLGEIGFEDLLHLRYLDLTGNQLERLPRGMGRFTRLQWLGLNFNRIASLSAGVGDWPELRCLYLRGNALRTLPEKASGWGQLVELDLFGNEPLASLPPGLVQYLRKRTPEQERRHVVLGKTALWDRMQDAGLKGEAKAAITAEMLRWIATQEHQPEPQGGEVSDEGNDGSDWLPKLVDKYGGVRIARALALLGLKDREWLAVAEDHRVLLVRAPSLEVRKTVSLAVESSRFSGGGGSLWEEWYAAGLDQAVEDIRARASLEPSPDVDEHRLVEKDGGTGKAVGRKGAR